MVSILIPCYNHEKYLMDCFESLMLQSFQNIELLICDDCSKDNSWQIINKHQEKLSKRFERVVIEKNSSNQGVVRTINRLLNLAQGEYIKVLASDDMLHPEYFSKCVEAFEKNTELDAIVTNGNLVPECTRYDNASSIENLIYKDAPDFRSDGMFERIYLSNIISAPATIIRKSVFEKLGPYDEKLKAEDWEYWLRMLSQDMKFGFIDNALCYYRQSEQSATSTVANKGLQRRRLNLLKSELIIIDKYRKYVSREDYIKKRNQCVMGHYWVAKNNKLKYLQLKTRIERIKNKLIGI